MADEHQTPGEAPVASPVRTRTPFRALLPHMLTATLAVAVSLLLQALLWPRASTTGLAPTAPVAVPSPSMDVIIPTPVASPVATTLPNDSVLRLEILDLEAQDRQIWSALYLLRAANQIDDAVFALQGNDLVEADRTLLSAYRSLDQAYTYSAEREKGPIDTFRLQLSQIRDDLHVRPERIDRRLRQLRQLVLSLVDEGS